MKKLLFLPLRIIHGALLLFWYVFAGSLCALVTLLSFSQKAGHWMVKNIYCRGFHIILGYSPTYSGLENLDFSKSYVLTANHESHMDTQAIYMSYPKALYFIGKKELKYVPIVGWVIAALGMIFIDRKNSEKARESMAKAAVLVRKGKNVISFPEGTRTKDGEIHAFKKGLFALALEAGVDVVPIAVCGAREVMPSGSFRITPGPIHVVFGKPIDHKKYKNDLAGFASATRQEVVRMKSEWMPKLANMRG